MFRERHSQLNLLSARVQYPDLIDRDSFYAMLGEKWSELFPDRHFKDMYCEDNGRPCVPPSRMFILLLLQLYDRCSDAEAIERSRCDIRWLAALDLQLGDKFCGQTTLQEFRAKMHLDEKYEEQFKSVLDSARLHGILKGSKLQAAIDTTPIFGRGAVKDTYNLVADGIRKLATVLARIDGQEPPDWARANDLSRYWESSSLKGDAEIDWSNDGERRVFLNGLVADARRILLIAHKRATVSSKEDSDQINEASALLIRLISQDTEPHSTEKKQSGKGKSAKERSTQSNDQAQPPTSDKAGCPNSDPEPTPQTDQRADTEPHSEKKKERSGKGRSAKEPSAQSKDPSSQQPTGDEGGSEPTNDKVEVSDVRSNEAPHAASKQAENKPSSGKPGESLQIRQGVAPDRIISSQDPEMRHGRKSASNQFDGYKQAMVVDTASKLILAVDVIPGNAPDNKDALGLIQAAERNAGIPIDKTLADCAFGDVATRRAFKDAGKDLYAKVPSPPANDLFSKSRFVLDLTNMIAICPERHTTNDYDYAYHRDGNAKRFCFPVETCGACAHREDCLRSDDLRRGRGRTITLNPEEDLLLQAREYQSTEEFREDIKARQTVEHRQARTVQLGVRQARYIGSAKTKYQSTLTAIIANLTLMAKVIMSKT